jgi:hypothetical protein
MESGRFFTKHSGFPAAIIIPPVLRTRLAGASAVGLFEAVVSGDSSQSLYHSSDAPYSFIIGLVQQSHLRLQYQGTQVSLHPYSPSTLQSREHHILRRQPRGRKVLCKHVWISHWHMHNWRMLKKESSNFLMMIVLTLISIADGVYSWTNEKYIMELNLYKYDVQSTSGRYLEKKWTVFFKAACVRNLKQRNKNISL